MRKFALRLVIVSIVYSSLCVNTSVVYGEATWLGTGSDIQTGANWLGGAVPGPTDANTGGPGTDGGATVGQADFVNGTNPTLNSTWAMRYLAFYGNVNSFSGTGTLTVGNTNTTSGNIDSWKATAPVTISVANIVMERASALYAASNGGGSADLIINSGTLKWASTSGTLTSGTVTFNAHGANLTVNPKVDFTSTGVNRSLSMNPNAGRVITLTNGVTATTRLTSMTIDGQTGGRVVLGDSTGWTRPVTINFADLEINSNNSLGVSSANPSYTQFGQSAGQTGALLLTNNITVPEYIYFYGRNSANLAQIVNKSGNNTLSGPLFNDNNGVNGATNKYQVIRSDSGSLTISGDIDAGTAAGAGGAYSGILVLRGASNGFVTGRVAQLGNNTFSEVRKDDAGTWTLSNANNSYTGKTTVMAGVLSLGATGAIPTSAGVDVRSGASFVTSGLAGGGLTLGSSQFLKGSGVVTGGIIGSAGTIFAPGDNGTDIGTLTVSGPLTIANAALQVQLTTTSTSNGGTNDKLVTQSTLNASGTNSVTIQPTAGYVGGGTYRLMEYTGASPSLANFNLAPVTLSFRQSAANLAVAAGQLNLVVTGDLGNLNWVGGVNANIWSDGQANANSINWTGAADNHFYNGDIVNFGNTGTTTPVVSGTVNPSHVNFNATNSQSYNVTGATIAVGGNLTNSSTGNVTLANTDTTVGGNLVASNSGIFTLSSNTTAVTGNSTISGSGTVNLSNTTSFTTTGAFNVTGSGNVNITSGNFTVAGAVSMNGTGTVAFSNTGSLLSVPSPVAINSGTLAINRTDDFTAANSTALATVFTGAGKLRKENINTIEITGDSSGFTGTMEVANGTLATRSTTALANTKVLAGATLEMGNNGAAAPGGGTKNVSIAGTGFNGQGAISVTIAGPSTGNNAHIGSLVLDDNATIRAKSLATGVANRAILWVDGPITGNGKTLTAIVDTSIYSATEIDIVNNGATNIGNLNLSGGGVFYIAGTTDLGATGTLTFGDNVVNGDPTDNTPGRLGIYGNTSGNGAPVSVTKPMQVTSANGGIELYRHTGNYTLASTIALAGDLNIDTWNTVDGTATMILSGAITGATGNLSFHMGSSTATRNGVFALTSDGNTYQGQTIVGGGGGFSGVLAATDFVAAVSIGNGGSTGSIGKGDIMLNPGNTGAYPLALQLNRTGAYTVQSNVFLNGNADVASIESIANGDATMTGAISGAGKVVVTTGKLTLTNANNFYAGTTTVNGGTLLVNGSHTGGGAYSVNAGGTLGGTGSIGSAVTVSSGGTIAPGASIESLDLNSLTLGAGSLLNFELGAPGTSDLLNVITADSFTANGGTFNFTNAGGLAAGTYTLIDYTGTLGGAFANLAVGLTQPAGFNFSLVNNSGNTSIDLLVAAGPVGVPGDYNNNGKVDAADYVIWRKTNGTAFQLQNEVSGVSPGQVTSADYDAWRQRFGNPPGSGAGLSNGAVPEPAIGGLILMALATLAASRRSKSIEAT